ncbi:MAG: misacylated tRNA(Ala) deacylase [Myxococcota bacterium]|jgi:misacylated tRNA(Ala) deacylase
MSLLACQRDPQTRVLETEVIACHPVDTGFDVVLADTVLYPEGGGQPADRGTIAGVPVSDVQSVGGEVRHRTATAVALGPVSVEVDWARRFDHMQQHSAQHLITAVAQERFGWATTSFHLRAEISDIELDTDAVSAAQVAELEEAVNAVVRAARPIRAREVPSDALAALGVRTRGMPQGWAGPVRLVEIDGVDLNTCGGTHVSSTAELGAVKLLHAERIRRGVRLPWLAGGRVRRELGAALELQRALGAELSAGPDTILAAVQRVAADAKSSAKHLSALQRELAMHIGRQLAGSGQPVLVLHRPDGDASFLDTVANTARKHAPEAWVFLTAGASDGAFLVEAPPEVVAALKPQILEILGARGGGRPGRLQGVATQLDARGRAADLLRGRRA